MSKTIRMFLVAGVAAAASFGSTAAANVNTGDAEAGTTQSAGANSGDAVGGQVIGGVVSGDTSIQASNHSQDVDLETGDAEATNQGLSAAVQFVNAGGLPPGTDVETGDAEAGLDQSATATSGDAIGGQVVGVVTPAGGSADLVLANHSEAVKAQTGQSQSANTGAAIAAQIVI